MKILRIRETLDKNPEEADGKAVKQLPIKCILQSSLKNSFLSAKQLVCEKLVNQNDWISSNGKWIHLAHQPGTPLRKENSTQTFLMLSPQKTNFLTKHFCPPLKQLPNPPKILFYSLPKCQFFKRKINSPSKERVSFNYCEKQFF